MNVINEKPCSVTFFSHSSGSKIDEFDNVANVNMHTERKVDYTYDAAGHKMVGFAGKIDKTLTIDVGKPIDKNELYKTVGVDLSVVPDAYDVRVIKFVPIRRHKKKRINKKWNKKYGIKYRSAIVTVKGWDLKTYQDGTFEFVK